MAISEKFSKKSFLTLTFGDGRCVLAGFSEISLHPPIWTGMPGLAELFGKFLLTLCNGNGRADFTNVSQIFFPHYPPDTRGSILRRLPKISLLTSLWTSDCGFGEILKNFSPHYPMEVNCGFEQRIGKFSSHFPLRMRLPFGKSLEDFPFTYMGEMSTTCTTHWRSDGGLAENLVKFLFSLPTGHQMAIWPPIFEIFSSQYPLEVECHNGPLFTEIFIPLPISENLGRIEPLNAKNPRAISGTEM